jgi:serine/threonine protein kinase
MTGSMDYLLGQVLSLIFYIMTLILYYRARKEYVGGKIAAAIKLIMVFLAILFLADFADYFFFTLLPLRRDTVLIIKILLKLAALCVLFFGGLRFFTRRPATHTSLRQTASKEHPTDRGAPTPWGDPAMAQADAGAFDAGDERKPKLGRYEILEQIGRGAMGIVYKGHDPKLNRLTAIKTIRFIDEFDDDQAEIIKEHFYHEAEVIAKLSHPNIVTVYDVGEDLDLSYLAMEYLEGQSLDKFAKPGHLLKIGECLDIVIQVCEALAYAHERHIIHRDIKPENIMVLRDGTVKVTDFGIARVTTSTKTRTGVIKGTPYYMSPEQTKGLKLTGQSDIFSLGVIFYQLLTGHLPFTGENMAAIMYQTTSVDPQPPETHNPDIDPAIVAILNRALAKRLDARYPSAQEMGDQLRTFRRHLPDKGLRQKDLAPTEAAGTESAGGLATGPGIELDGVRLEMDATATLEVPSSASGAEEITAIDSSELDSAFQKTAEQPTEVPGMGSPKARQTYPPDFDWDYGAEEGADTPVDEDRAFSESVIERVGTRFSITENLFSRMTSLVIIGSFAAILLSGVYYLFLRPSASDVPYDEEIEAKLAEQKRQIQAIHARLAAERKAQQEDLAKAADADAQVPAVTQAPVEEAKPEKVAETDETRQAEQERQARIEQAKREEQERLARVEKARQAEEERLARIEQAKRAEAERRARTERERLAQLQQAELAAISKLVTDGRDAWQRQDYRQARKYYEAALDKVSQSAFKKERRFADYQKEIEAALKDDDIVYGAKGYIKYHNKWMSPQDYETALFQEGYVKYRGQLIHHTALRGTIERISEPDVNMYLSLRYQGQRVHTKNIQFKRIILDRSTSQSADYTVYYDWEVWTFNDIDRGQCALKISYDVATDNWRMVKGCE